MYHKEQETRPKPELSTEKKQHSEGNQTTAASSIYSRSTFQDLDLPVGRIGDLLQSFDVAAEPAFMSSMYLMLDAVK